MVKDFTKVRPSYQDIHVNLASCHHPNSWYGKDYRLGPFSYLYFCAYLKSDILVIFFFICYFTVNYFVSSLTFL